MSKLSLPSETASFYNPETIEQLEADISDCLKKQGHDPPKDLKDLVEVFLLPRIPVDDSKTQLEEVISIVARIPFCDAAQFLNRILITQVWNDIRKPPKLIAGDLYRSADGSDYTRAFDRFYGKAGSRYAIAARSKRPFTNLPDAKDVFDKVMARDEFKPHQSGISAVLFYLALIITHDLFNTNHDDPNFNRNSSYLDLSPLYGNSIEQNKSIRLFDKGLLKPDTFADSRILLQPPGVSTLLILFSRNHNYIARKLLEINEGGRFSLKGHGDSATKKQDEDLFQTARLINCGYYLKIVIHNYLRTILGIDQTKSPYIIDPTIPYGKSWLLPELPTGVGNHTTLEFNYIYRWHPAISKEDEEWIETKFFKDILGINCPPEDLSEKEFREKVAAWRKKLSKDPSHWTFGGLHKGKDHKYSTSDLARVLVNGTNYISGSFGARGIPRAFRMVELIGIEAARYSGLCSLNDFRRSFNLVPYKSFEDMNPDPVIANELKNLYGDVDNVELYPGLMTEKTKPTKIGSAFGLPFTISRALLADAVNVVRNDRFVTDEFNPYSLTSWGFAELQSNPFDLATGGLIHKIILRELPGIYKENSAWALYPFTTPEQTLKNLKNRDDGLWQKIDFSEPQIPK